MFTRYNKNKKQRAVKNHVLPMRKGGGRGSGGGREHFHVCRVKYLPVHESYSEVSFEERNSICKAVASKNV